MNYDKDCFDSIKKKISSSKDSLDIIKTKINNATSELNSYNLIKRQQGKTSINGIISINDEMLSFIELTMKEYDILIEEINTDINSTSASNIDATTLTNTGINVGVSIATSITELALFSRDLSNVNLYDDVYAGHYYAQNDARWRDIKYARGTMGGGSCQTLAVVNSLANLGFYDTYDNSKDPTEAFVLAVKEIIMPTSGQRNANLGVIIDRLNSDRVKNGKDKIDISVISTNKDGYCTSFSKMMDSVNDTEVGSSKWLCFKGEKGDTFVDRIEYIEENKNPGDVYSYSVCRVAANPKQLIGGKYGHYLTINNFQFDENNKITNVYVYDSYARDFEDTTVTLNGKECKVSGYISTNKKNKDHLFEMITPGLLKMPRDVIPKCGFGSGNLIITKVKEGN